MAISIIDSFSLKAKKHLDERSSFATKQEMMDYDKEALAVGLISYCEEDGMNYQWDGAQWNELGAGGGSSVSATYEPDTFTLKLKGVKQGV